MKQSQMIYVASILALLTAATLAWAVSHPCDCSHDEAAVEGETAEVSAE